MSEREWYIEIAPTFPPPGSGDERDAALTSEIFNGTEEEAEERAKQLCEAYRENYRVPRGVHTAIDAVRRARGDLCDAANVLGISPAGKEVWKWVERLDQTIEDFTSLPVSLRSYSESSERYPLYNADFGHFDIVYSISKHETPPAEPRM